MGKPPDTIDGARVLEWAWSGEEPFGHVRDADGTVNIEIYGLAICQYLGSLTVYRFSCNRDWETEQDADYDSVEEAKARLPAQYRLVPARWIKAGGEA
jgi:hypothetical protein